MVSNLLYFMRSGWFVITYYLFSIIWSTYDRSKWSDIRGTWRLYTAIPKSKGFSFDTTRIFYKNDIYTFICFPGNLVPLSIYIWYNLARRTRWWSCVFRTYWRLCGWFFYFSIVSQTSVLKIRKMNYYIKQKYIFTKEA